MRMTLRAAWINEHASLKEDPSVEWGKFKRAHADTEFHQALNLIIGNIEVNYSEPE